VKLQAPGSTSRGSGEGVGIPVVVVSNGFLFSQAGVAVQTVNKELYIRTEPNLFFM